MALENARNTVNFKINQDVKHWPPPPPHTHTHLVKASRMKVGWLHRVYRATPTRSKHSDFQLDTWKNACMCINQAYQFHMTPSQNSSNLKTLFVPLFILDLTIVQHLENLFAYPGQLYTHQNWRPHDYELGWVWVQATGESICTWFPECITIINSVKVLSFM